MKRVRLLALLGLVLACSKSAPSGPIIPPWQVLVTGVKPGGFALPPALVVCEADGSGCSPVKAGLKLGGNKLVRTERGVSEFELDSATRVEVAEGSELLLEDAGGRTLELRSGGMALSRSGPAPDAGPLLVRLVDRTLQLTGRTAIVAQLENVNRGQLFVTRGTVKSVEPAGSLPPIRDYHPGEGATFERKGPADLHAVFSGAVSRFRQSVLAIADTPPPPKTVVAPPRGLGTMTARLPGTTTVIEGVRLAQHRVRAVVRNGVAQTEVEEVFQNDTDRVLEGRYVFPLPPDATISGLTLFVGDKPVQGELVEKKRAAAIFKGIVEDTVRPRDPALLEWVAGSQFSLKIFPIPSRGSRKVVLRYQQVLTSDGPRQVYAYPLSFGAERRTPIDELSIDVELSDAGQAVQGVVASGYAATVQPSAESTRVTLRADKIAPDHDFAVSFKRAAPGATVARVEQGFVALRLRAELPSNLPVPAFRRQDRVVVVDASQSQSTESFAAARELALGILSGLEPDERFALLLCDSACQALPARGMTAASSGALDQARALLEARKPSGSSDLAGALLGAAERVPAGAAVQVVYVGDGAPSAGELSVPSIAGRVRSSLGERKVDLRLFGAGPSVDEVTLGGLARALGGSYDNVASAGPLAEQAALLVTGLRSPLVVAPVVEASGLTELEPRGLPNLRLGEEIVVVGRLASAALDGSAPFDVTLKGKLEGAPYALVRAASAKPGTDAPFAARLWAEARIRELQTSDAPDRAQQVIELSKRFRVMSRETSWLVLESEQMFAEFGIPRSKAAAEGQAAGEGSAEQRALQSQELSQLEQGALTGDSDALGRAAEKDDSPRSESAPAPASPAKPAPSPAPAPAPPSGPSRGSDGSSGLGGSTKSSEAEGAGSGASTSIAGPRAVVGVGGVTQSGGTVSNAARVAAGMRAGIRACYQRSLNQNPDVAGTARMQLRVGEAGEVTNVSVAPSGNLPPDLIACITARARAARFDAPEGGSAVLLIPLKLSSEVESRPPALPPSPRPRPEPPADVAVSRPGDDSWLGQGQAALDKLQAELAASPSSRKRNEALVRGLLLRGRFAPALAAAEHFVELDPDLPAARELLAYAAVAGGDRQRAAAAVDAITETAPSELKAHGRAARAFEALADEVRACAHWRSVFELAPKVDSALYEALRCRARVLGDRAAALRDAKALPKPGPLVARLLPLLESGAIPAFEKSSGSVGQFEASLTCEPQAECPYVIVITPTGTVFSPWTPALGRSSPTSFAFSGLLTGVYRVLLVGGAPSAKGQVEVRALNVRNTFAFGPGHAQAVAFTQVTMAPAGLAGLGIGSISRF